VTFGSNATLKFYPTQSDCQEAKFSTDTESVPRTRDG
jgi:hypothetical protein